MYLLSTTNDTSYVIHFRSIFVQEKKMYFIFTLFSNSKAKATSWIFGSTSKYVSTAGMFISAIDTLDTLAETNISNFIDDNEGGESTISNSDDDKRLKYFYVKKVILYFNQLYYLWIIHILIQLSFIKIER